MTDRVRFLSKVVVATVPPIAGWSRGPCWRLRARIDTRSGASRFSVRRGKEGGRKVSGHRFAYLTFVARTPLPLDHLCRRRWCVNYNHLEPVTLAVNTARGASPSARLHREGACKRGHDVTGANGYLWRNKRQCRRCKLAALRRWRARVRAAAA